MNKKRLAEIRISEANSHQKLYTTKKLYEKGSWLSKPVKSVMELLPNLYDYEEINILDLGCGVGRNAIAVARELKDKNCHIDCVDILLLAIEELKRNSNIYNVSNTINGYISPLEDFKIKKDFYNLIMCISSLEHVNSKENLIKTLKKIKNGLKNKGIVCLIMNSDIIEINQYTLKTIEPDFEINLSSNELFKLLDEEFKNYKTIKKSLKPQNYTITRNNTTSKLYTNVVTYISRK